AYSMRFPIYPRLTRPNSQRLSTRSLAAIPGESIQGDTRERPAAEQPVEADRAGKLERGRLTGCSTDTETRGAKRVKLAELWQDRPLQERALLSPPDAILMRIRNGLTSTSEHTVSGTIISDGSFEIASKRRWTNAYEPRLKGTVSKHSTGSLLQCRLSMDRAPARMLKIWTPFAALVLTALIAFAAYLTTLGPREAASVVFLLPLGFGAGVPWIQAYRGWRKGPVLERWLEAAVDDGD